MDNYKKWDKEDYYTFFLIYAAKADFTVVDEEKEYILNHSNKKVYNRISKDFNNYTDVQNNDILEYFVINYCKTREEKIKIYFEMKEVLLVDGVLAASENLFLRQLRKIIVNNSTDDIADILD
ncbi:MAG: TerB family tellurite resistance protein [Bacteroidales bacterium]|nr:TerB family tellurite resistance protein [Bacteroidales bacterium]